MSSGICEVKLNYESKRSSDQGKVLLFYVLK